MTVTKQNNRQVVKQRFRGREIPIRWNKNRTILDWHFA